jgi:ribosomal protein L27
MGQIEEEGWEEGGVANTVIIIRQDGGKGQKGRNGRKGRDLHFFLFLFPTQGRVAFKADGDHVKSHVPNLEGQLLKLLPTRPPSTTRRRAGQEDTVREDAG